MPDPSQTHRPRAGAGRREDGPQAAPRSHPEAHAVLRRMPEYRTGLEIRRADLAFERGEVPPPGPWSPLSAAAGLTQAYLEHLERVEPGLDPAEQAELAYVGEQFALAHALPGSSCRYVDFGRAVASVDPDHPHVGAYVDTRLAHGDRDGPEGGILLVPRPPAGGAFLDRHRALSRVSPHWWRPGEGPDAALDGLPAGHPDRAALRLALALAHA